MCQTIKQRPVAKVLQIEHMEGHQEWGQALQLLRRLCEKPEALTPAPRGLSAGLTGRPSAWHALSLLQRIPDEGTAARLAVQHMADWLLRVRCPTAVFPYKATQPAG